MSKNKPFVKIASSAFLRADLMLLTPRAFRALLVLASWSAEWDRHGRFPNDLVGRMLRTGKRVTASILGELTTARAHIGRPLVWLDGADLVINEEVISFGRDGTSWDQRDTKKVLARDGRRCRYCGVECFEDLTFDHVFPRSRGGGDNQANLVVACQSCNSRKSDRTPEEAKMPLLPVPESA